MLWPTTFNLQSFCQNYESQMGRMDQNVLNTSRLLERINAKCFMHVFNNMPNAALVRACSPDTFKVRFLLENDRELIRAKSRRERLCYFPFYYIIKVRVNLKILSEKEGRV